MGLGQFACGMLRMTTCMHLQGKVLLVVNVASECGFTKQYAGLAELYDKYKNKGFEGLSCKTRLCGNSRALVYMFATTVASERWASILLVSLCSAGVPMQPIRFSGKIR